MPKDKADAAIKRASGKEAANYQEIIYEGYAPHGVALLVETRDRQPDPHRGQRAQHLHEARRATWRTTGSVSFLFQKMGVFRLDPAPESTRMSSSSI